MVNHSDCQTEDLNSTNSLPAEPLEGIFSGCQQEVKALFGHIYILLV